MLRQLRARISPVPDWFSIYGTKRLVFSHRRFPNIPNTPMPVYPVNGRQTPLLGQAGSVAISDAVREDHFNSFINSKPCKPRSTRIVGWKPPPSRSTQKLSRVRGIPDLPQGGCSLLPEDCTGDLYLQTCLMEEDVHSCLAELGHSFSRKVYGILCEFYQSVIYELLIWALFIRVPKCTSCHPRYSSPTCTIQRCYSLQSWESGA